MYVILNQSQQGDPALYPVWTALGWFQNVKDLTCDIEEHYHDSPEIWVWHKGIADGTIDGASLELKYGTIVYTPAKCLHSYKSHGIHSNTGITPKKLPNARTGHIHLDETDELLIPEMQPFWFTDEDDAAIKRVDFPKTSFLRNVYCRKFNPGNLIIKEKSKTWIAILVREGGIHGFIDDDVINCDTDDLLLIGAESVIELHSDIISEAVIALGW